MGKLGSVDFWKPALIRALRTAIIIAIPYVPTLITDSAYLLVLSAAGFGFITSLITSVVNLPEATDKTVPWYYALLERAAKTAGQALLTGFGTAVLFQDVDWTLIGPAVATAVLGSILLGFLKTLPETVTPVAEVQLPVLTAPVVDGGEAKVQGVTPVARVEVPAEGDVLSADGTAPNGAKG